MNGLKKPGQQEQVDGFGFESCDSSSNFIRSYEGGESNNQIILKQQKICLFKLHFIFQMDHFVIGSWKANKFHLCLFQCNTTPTL